MEIVDADGAHVGTVDTVEGERLKLTKKDSRDGQHHFLEKKRMTASEDRRLVLCDRSRGPPSQRKSSVFWSPQRLFNVGDQVVGIFDSNGNADQRVR
jgi:hypothetical protein